MWGVFFLQDSMTNRLYLVSFCDLGYSLIFILYIIWMRYHNFKLSKQNQQENIDVSHYALEISGFPEIIMEDEVLKSHFE